MPVERSRVSWRPKLLRPSEPSKSCSVLKPRKSMVLSVISKRASGWRSCGWPSWARAEVCGGGGACGGFAGVFGVADEFHERFTALPTSKRDSSHPQADPFAGAKGEEKIGLLRSE